MDENEKLDASVLKGLFDQGVKYTDIEMEERHSN
jgi:hypothetical protein